MDTRPSHLIREDKLAGVIHIYVSGFFDRDSLEVHFKELQATIHRWRCRAIPIRALANTVDLMPHSPENQAFVSSSHNAIYRDGDKVAVLVSSTLVKMQMRRAFSNQLMEFFISENAALTWLDSQRDSTR